MAKQTNYIKCDKCKKYNDDSIMTIAKFTARSWLPFINDLKDKELLLCLDCKKKFDEGKLKV